MCSCSFPVFHRVLCFAQPCLDPCPLLGREKLVGELSSLAAFFRVESHVVTTLVSGSATSMQYRNLSTLVAWRF